MQQELESTDSEDKFKEEKQLLKVDGTSNKHGACVGVVLITLEESLIEISIKLDFQVSNNEVEYQVLIYGLSMT